VSDTLARVKELVADGDYRGSNHGVAELEKDGLVIEELIASLAAAMVVEDYPESHYGPTVLVLQANHDGSPVHVLWGVPKATGRPAVLVTAYRPDPKRWSGDLRRRR
jgi:hypothetical protein